MLKALRVAKHPDMSHEQDLPTIHGHLDPQVQKAATNATQKSGVSECSLEGLGFAGVSQGFLLRARTGEQSQASFWGRTGPFCEVQVKRCIGLAVRYHLDFIALPLSRWGGKS